MSRPPRETDTHSFRVGARGCNAYVLYVKYVECFVAHAQKLYKCDGAVLAVRQVTLTQHQSRGMLDAARVAYMVSPMPGRKC